jgi:predicted metal-dependent phosphoesterase TrpH
VISVDLHLHTCYSYDCATPLPEVVRSCRRAGFDCAAVTDHNTISGALKLRDGGMFRVIVGEEISTTRGELLGLFLTAPVPRGLSPLETIDRIKDQGGLVCMPHPLGRKPFLNTVDMGSSLNGRFTPAARLLRANRLLTEDVLSRLDLLEVINCRTPFASTWAATRRLADLCGLPLTAGSDAHTPGEIGHARVVMPDFCDAPTFLTGIRAAELSGTRSSVFVHIASMYAKFGRRRCSD